MIKYRLALPDDAMEICYIIRNSIKEACQLDHHNNIYIINRWLSSKSELFIKNLIRHDPEGFFVALNGPNICGFGGITKQGVITLVYVAPWQLSHGVGRGILILLEKRAKKLGLTEITLASTKTAYDFYKHLGYHDNGNLEKMPDGRSVMPMRRHIF